MSSRPRVKPGWFGGRRFGRWALTLGFFCLALAVILWTGTGTGPRLRGLIDLVRSSGGRLPALSSVYPNTRPGVRYVGDGACVRCHADIAGPYRDHPMGRSLRPIDVASLPEETSGSTPAFEAQGLE